MALFSKVSLLERRLVHSELPGDPHPLLLRREVFPDRDRIPVIARLHGRG